MRLPRMTMRRWIVATAFVAVVCWGMLRARALERRAEFHAGEHQACLQRATIAVNRYQTEREACVLLPRTALIEIAEDFEAAPELRELAEYHADLANLYRRAVCYPWMLVPAEKPFVPNDRNRASEWLRAKAEAYKSLEHDRREFARLAEDRREPKYAAEHLRLAEEDARIAADYKRRARRIESLYGP